MAVIDVQVHAYERNHPGRPWAGHLHGPASATGEKMVVAMDAVGVDAAIIVSTFNLYRYDPSYTLEVYAQYPERFRVVKPIDPADPAVDDVLADWAKTKGAVGVQADVAGRADFRSCRPAPQSGVRRRRAAWLAGQFPVLGAPG
jgi:L-fuconolactonase